MIFRSPNPRNMTSTRHSSVAQALASGDYAFADLGCGVGGSLEHCLHRFGRAPGLGLEVDATLVAEAARHGLDVMEADLLAVDAPEGCLSYTSMMDFLEHLPDEASAVRVLGTFGRASRDFLFIRHPSFEEIDYLAELGFKIDWTHWTGHPNMMRLADFERVFAGLGWRDVTIQPRHRIADSTHPRVIPITAPIDVVTYDPHKHGPKPTVRFDRPLYTQFDIFVRLNPDLDDSAWEAVLASDKLDDELTARDTAGYYSAADSTWHMRPTNTGGTALTIVPYGAPGRDLKPITGDWDGDGYDGIGVYDGSTGDFFLRNAPAPGAADVAIRFGAPGAIPISGDWTGSGVDGIGVYIPETGRWFLRTSLASGDADLSFGFGPVGEGWIPVTGDWDGTGVDSVGLYDPRTSSWHLRRTTRVESDHTSFAFGFPGARPVTGDWDGDGVDSIGVYVPDSGEWHLRNSNTSGGTNVLFSFPTADGVALAARWSA
jgi:hypothetical protein